MRSITNAAKGRLRRTRRKQRGGNSTAKAKESYIYLRTTGGLNDNLVQLAKCTEYAKHHGRSIILEMPTYAATDLTTVFDFSSFPVPIYTNYKEKQKELAGKPIVPEYYGTLEHPHPHGTTFIRGAWSTKEGQPLRFDLGKSYPSDTVLVYAAGGGGEGDSAVELLNHIRLTDEVKNHYKQELEKYKIPPEYISLHLRATDRKLNITNNITGMLLKDSNTIIKAPSTGNANRDSLRKIEHFVHAHPHLPIFVAGDNPKLIDKLQTKYPNIITNTPDHPKCESNSKCEALHQHGSTDPNNLRNAITDLLILAGAKAIMTSQGGYSRLAKKLLKRRDIRDKLLS